MHRIKVNIFDLFYLLPIALFIVKLPSSINLHNHHSVLRAVRFALQIILWMPFFPREFWQHYTRPEQQAKCQMEKVDQVSAFSLWPSRLASSSDGLVPPPSSPALIRNRRSRSVAHNSCDAHMWSSLGSDLNRANACTKFDTRARPHALMFSNVLFF